MEGDPNFRAWSELIPDTLGLIFSNLEAEEIIKVIPLVCKSWCKVVEGPYCWQRINTGEFLIEKKVKQLLRTVIPRSSGSLHELCVSFIDDDMLSFIAEHAGSLQKFEILNSNITDSGLEQFATKSTSLTTLVVRNNTGISMPSLEAIMRTCKTLVSLTWGNYAMLMSEKPSHDEDESVMPNLKRLSLHCYMINDWVVLGLLSRCPNLEWVKIRGAYGLDPRIVEEKYPNIVTLDISGEAYSDSDYSGHWGDCSGYGSVDCYDEYGRSNDNLHGDYDYDIYDEYGGYDL